MTAETREARLAEAFVALADTLVVGYDVVELLQSLVDRCRLILDAADVGIILANGDGELDVIASTSERSRLVELLQLRAGEGPCVEAFLTGKAVSLPQLTPVETRWPKFFVGARELGFASVHSVPLRLREQTIGSLNLFREKAGALSPEDAVAAQALADVATIGILQERAFRELDFTRQQLQRALDSRVVIEQAKGIVAQQRGFDMDAAFQLLRSTARSHSLRLEELAQRVVQGTTRL